MTEAERLAALHAFYGRGRHTTVVDEILDIIEEEE